MPHTRRELYVCKWNQWRFQLPFWQLLTSSGTCSLDDLLNQCYWTILRVRQGLLWAHQHATDSQKYRLHATLHALLPNSFQVCGSCILDKCFTSVSMHASHLTWHVPLSQSSLEGNKVTLRTQMTWTWRVEIFHHLCLHALSVMCGALMDAPERNGQS